MAATPSIKISKTFLYRGLTRTFSNRYHFNGGTPADATHWTTLADAVTAAEKAIYVPTVCVITQATGYAAGSDVPVFTKAYSLAATGAFASWGGAPGDVAGLIRYSTTARTPKMHPVYLFNYYHGIGYQTGIANNWDTVNTNQRTAMGTYASAWISGFSDGTNTLVRAGPNGATATGSLVEPNLTHRDLPRA